MLHDDIANAIKNKDEQEDFFKPGFGGKSLVGSMAQPDQSAFDISIRPDMEGYR